MISVGEEVTCYLVVQKGRAMLCNIEEEGDEDNPISGKEALGLLMEVLARGDCHIKLLTSDVLDLLLVYYSDAKLEENDLVLIPDVRIGNSLEGDGDQGDSVETATLVPEDWPYPLDPKEMQLKIGPLLLDTIDGWHNIGYDIDRLIKGLEGSPDTIWNLFLEYSDNITKLEKFRSYFDELDFTGYEQDMKDIIAHFSRPDDIDIIKEKIYVLASKVEATEEEAMAEEEDMDFDTTDLEPFDDSGNEVIGEIESPEPEPSEPSSETDGVEPDEPSDGPKGSVGQPEGTDELPDKTENREGVGQPEGTDDVPEYDKPAPDIPDEQTTEEGPSLPAVKLKSPGDESGDGDAQEEDAEEKKAREELDKRRTELKEKLDDIASQGYDVSSIAGLLDSDINKAWDMLSGFLDGVEILKQLRSRLEDIRKDASSRFPRETKSIEALLKDPGKAKAATAELAKLEARLEKAMEEEADQDALAGVREEALKQINTWKETGFELEEPEKAVKDADSEEDIHRIIKDLTVSVGKMTDLSERLDALEVEGYEDQVTAIDELLPHPDRTEDAAKLIEKLEKDVSAHMEELEGEMKALEGLRLQISAWAKDGFETSYLEDAASEDELETLTQKVDEFRDKLEQIGDVEKELANIDKKAFSDELREIYDLMKDPRNMETILIMKKELRDKVTRSKSSAKKKSDWLKQQAEMKRKMLDLRKEEKVKDISRFIFEKKKLDALNTDEDVQEYFNDISSKIAGEINEIEQDLGSFFKDTDRIITKTLGISNINTFHTTAPQPQMVEEDERRLNMYQTALELAWEDDKITPDEEIILEGLREILGISDSEHETLENEVLGRSPRQRNMEVYQCAFERAWEDGAISERNRFMLDGLKKSLELNDSDIKTMEDSIIDRYPDGMAAARGMARPEEKPAGAARTATRSGKGKKASPSKKKSSPGAKKSKKNLSGASDDLLNKFDSVAKVKEKKGASKGEKGGSGKDKPKEEKGKPKEEKGKKDTGEEKLPSEKEFEAMTKAKLSELAKTLDIQVKSKWTKADIIKALNARKNG